MMKITQEMRDNNGVPSELDQPKAAAAQAEGAKAGDATTATDLSSSEKHITPSVTTAGTVTGAPNNVASNEDISPEGLLNVISQEWKNEMERIISLGLNGYKRRKESRNDCLVQSGHAEIGCSNVLKLSRNKFRSSSSEIIVRSMKSDKISKARSI